MMKTLIVSLSIVGHTTAINALEPNKIREPEDYLPQTTWDYEAEAEAILTGDCTLYISSYLALARCPTDIYYWKADKFFLFNKRDEDDYKYR